MSNFETLLFSEDLKVKLMNIAMSKTFNKDNAFDLIQNTYLKAIENQDKFDGSNIDAWTVTILKNLFIDSTRKKTEELMGDDLPDTTANDDTESIIIENELEEERDRCMKTLSNDERDVIALHQSSSYDEISKILNIKPGTLRQILRRAKDKFIQCMGFENE